MLDITALTTLPSVATWWDERLHGTGNGETHMRRSSSRGAEPYVVRKLVYVTWGRRWSQYGYQMCPNSRVTNSCMLQMTRRCMFGIWTHGNAFTSSGMTVAWMGQPYVQIRSTTTSSAGRSACGSMLDVNGWPQAVLQIFTDFNCAN